MNMYRMNSRKEIRAKEGMHERYIIPETNTYRPKSFYSQIVENRNCKNFFFKSNSSSTFSSSPKVYLSFFQHLSPPNTVID